MTTRQKSNLCAAIGLLAFLAVLGIVGGMTLGDMPTVRGAILAGLSEIVSAAMLWKAGWIRL